MSWKFFTAQGQQKTFDYGSALASLGAMVPLYDVTLGAAAANVDIQNISQNYAHLRLVFHGRSDAVASAVYLYIRLNNDSGSNYDVQRLFGNAASAAADESFAATSLNAGNIPASSSTSNVFGIAVYDIPSYANTSYNKAIHMANSHKGSTSTGGMAHILGSGFWRSSSAINRITVYASSGNLIAGTRVTLYGLGVVAPPSPGSILPVAYGTSLPASPVDGQEAILVDSTTNPSYQWRFRYNGSSTSSYKWEYVGGTPLTAAVDTLEYTTSGTYAALSTAGPSVALPRAGDYIVELGAFVQQPQASGYAFYMSYDIGSTGAVDADGIRMDQYDATTPRSASTQYRNRLKTGLSAVTLTCKYKSAGSANCGWGNRFISVTPVRVS